MSDTDATQARQDVVADVDEILEHVINANMLSMPYDVYLELFDAVDGLGVEIENIQAENAKLRELCSELLRMAESHDPEWLHWPEVHEELRNLGVEVANDLDRRGA